MSQQNLLKDQQKPQSEIKLETPLGEIVFNKEELEKTIGKFKIITIIILLLMIMILMFKNNVVISHTFQALNIA